MSTADADDAIGPSQGYWAGLRLLKETRRELWIVQLIAFLESLSRFSILAITPLFLWTELGLEDAQGSHYMILIATAAFLGGILVGPIIDWLGIRRSLLVALTVSLVATAVVVGAVLVQGIPGRTFLILAGLATRGVFLTAVPATQFIAQKRYSSQRARATLFYVGPLVVNLAGFLAPILGWAVLGLDRDSADIAFVFSLVLLGASLLLTLRFVRNEDQLQGAGEKADKALALRRKTPLAVIQAILPTADFWKVAALGALLTTPRFALLGLGLLLPKYLERTIGPDAAADNMTVITALVAIVGMLVLLPVVHRWSTYRAICFGSLLLAASAFIMALPVSGEAIYVTTILWLVALSIGEVIYAPRFSEYAATMAPVGGEGTYYSLLGLPWFVVKSGFSMVAGYLLLRWVSVPPLDEPLQLRELMEAGSLDYLDSPPAMWLVLAGFSVIGPVLAILLRRWFTRGTPFEFGTGGAAWRLPG